MSQVVRVQLPLRCSSANFLDRLFWPLGHKKGLNSSLSPANTTQPFTPTRKKFLYAYLNLYRGFSFQILENDINYEGRPGLKTAYIKDAHDIY